MRWPDDLCSSTSISFHQSPCILCFTLDGLAGWFCIITSMKAWLLICLPTFLCVVDALARWFLQLFSSHCSLGQCAMLLYLCRILQLYLNALAFVFWMPWLDDFASFDSQSTSVCLLDAWPDVSRKHVCLWEKFPQTVSLARCFYFSKTKHGQMVVLDSMATYPWDLRKVWEWIMPGSNAPQEAQQPM